MIIDTISSIIYLLICLISTSIITLLERYILAIFSIDLDQTDDFWIHSTNSRWSQTFTKQTISYHTNQSTVQMSIGVILLTPLTLAFDQESTVAQFYRLRVNAALFRRGRYMNFISTLAIGWDTHNKFSILSLSRFLISSLCVEIGFLFYFSYLILLIPQECLQSLLYLNRYPCEWSFALLFSFNCIDSDWHRTSSFRYHRGWVRTYRWYYQWERGCWFSFIFSQNTWWLFLSALLRVVFYSELFSTQDYFSACWVFSLTRTESFLPRIRWDTLINAFGQFYMILICFRLSFYFRI